MCRIVFKYVFKYSICKHYVTKERSTLQLTLQSREKISGKKIPIKGPGSCSL